MPGLRDGLVALFRRALHRDVDGRFDTLRQMEDARRPVLTTVDVVAPPSTPATLGLEGETLAETRDTHAAAATWTPRWRPPAVLAAVSVAHGFSATTVGELLDVPLYEIARTRGAARLSPPQGRKGYARVETYEMDGNAVQDDCAFRAVEDLAVQVDAQASCTPVDVDSGRMHDPADRGWSLVPGWEHATGPNRDSVARRSSRSGSTPSR